MAFGFSGFGTPTATPPAGLRVAPPPPAAPPPPGPAPSPSLNPYATRTPQAPAGYAQLATPSPIAPGTSIASPFGQQTYGTNGASTFTGSSATTAPGTPASPAAPTGPNAYNPATTYPGPYANNADNYKVWLNNQNGGNIAPPAPATDPNVTAGSPWLASAGGNGPTGSFGLNPQNFATPGYAQSVATQYGGKVIQGTPYAPGSPFYSSQPQNMVQMPAGNLINPAILAQLYSHGYSPSYVQGLVQNYTSGNDAYNPGVPDTVSQNTWGYNTNAPAVAAQNFQSGTTPYAQTLAQNPGSIPGGFLGPGQTTSNNPATYTQPNPGLTSALSGTAPSNTNNGQINPQDLFAFLTSPTVQNLYGGNPLSQAGAFQPLLSMLASGGNGNNLGSIAALLNIINSSRSMPQNGNLSPLFFNSSSQAPQSLYYPQFG